MPDPRVPLQGSEPERCGCQRYGEGGKFWKCCRFHWNESNIQHELERARSWERRGRLDKNDQYDRQVLRFYDELCYWAAKGIGDAGSVGSIYNAASKRRISGNDKENAA